MQFADLMCLRQDALVFSIGRHRMHGFAARFPIGKACRGQKLPRIWAGKNLAHSHFRPMLLVDRLPSSTNPQDIFLFGIFLGDGFFPVNVLAAVRAVPEVCRIYCATANPTQVIVAQ